MDRHAIVTGAARGIGAAIARALAAEGTTVTLLGRSRDALQQLQAELPGSGIAVADITSEPDVRAAFAQGRTIRPSKLCTRQSASFKPCLIVMTAVWRHRDRM